MLGGRDVALGLGVVIALDRGAPVRGWLEAGALADSVDLVSCMLAGDDIPNAARLNTIVLAAGAGLAGVWLSRQLDPPPAADPGHPEAIATGHPAEPRGAGP
jgi:peptide-methionine (R)-S-oxide reductase